MATADITVMGAGIFGLAIGYACARRGARVQVIDPAGVGAGASGGIVGALAPHTPENWNDKKEFQFLSLIEAREFWGGVDDLSGLSSGYSPTGRLQPVPDERALELARARQQSAQVHWRGQATWSVLPSSDFASWGPPSPTGTVIHDTLSAAVNPAAACQSLAAALRGLGGEIYRAASPAGSVIWATGHEGLKELSRQLDRHVGGGVKGQAALLRHDAGGQPQVFSGGVHIVPHLNGTVAIGSTSEREFTDPKSTDAQLDDLIERAREAMPALGQAPVVGRWAGVRPRSRSRAPMLGAWPGRPGHFIANGGFKIGFGVAPGVARVMADLVLDGRDGEIPPGFRVEANL